MENKSSYISEFWAKTPLTKNIPIKASVGTLYTNQTLVQRFIKMVDESDFFQKNNLNTPIIELIQKGIILPVYRDKNFIDKLVHKIKNYPPNDIRNAKNALALFSLLDDKIFIFIEKMTNFLGFTDDDFVGKILLHELMHMYSSKIDILKYFQKPLLVFYQNLFENLAEEIITNKKALNDFIRFIYYDIERKGNFKKLGKDGWKKRVYPLFESRDMKFMIEYIQDSIIEDFLLKGESLNLDNAFISFYNSVKKAYNKLGITPASGIFFIQELWAPSEVLAILAESNPNDRLVILALKTLVKNRNP